MLSIWQAGKDRGQTKLRTNVRLKSGFNTGGGERIRRYFFHPRVGYLERRVIDKAFKSVDYFKVPAVKSRNLSETSEKLLKGLNLLTELSMDDNCVLQESD